MDTLTVVFAVCRLCVNSNAQSKDDNYKAFTKLDLPSPIFIAPNPPRCCNRVIAQASRIDCPLLIVESISLRTEELP